MPKGVYKRKPFSEEHKQHIREAHKGKTPWIAGKHHTEQTKKKMRGRILSEKHKENLSKSHLGMHCSPETEFKKGNKINLGRHNSPETEFKPGHPVSSRVRDIVSKTHKDRKLSQKHKDKIGIKSKEFMNSKEGLKKVLHRRIPTSLEEKFQNIIDKCNLPYKYVGNGAFTVGRYNPDFINVNSKKIAIEVYARYYKKRHIADIEQWKRERTEAFKKYGWKVIYFDETQVKEDYVLSMLEVT